MITALCIMTSHCVDLLFCECEGSLWSGGLDCCVTWFPAGQVTWCRPLLTGRQEALVCGVSHASHVSLKMLVGSFIMH